MRLGRRVNRLLRRYGGDAVVEWDSHLEPVKAMIQPLYYKNKMYLEGSYLPDGYFDGGHFLYIGPAGVRLDRLPFYAAVTWCGSRYRVKRAEMVRLMDEDLYLWAVLQICGEGSDEPV